MTTVGTKLYLIANNAICNNTIRKLQKESAIEYLNFSKSLVGRQVDEIKELKLEVSKHFLFFNRTEIFKDKYDPHHSWHDRHIKNITIPFFNYLKLNNLSEFVKELDSAEHTTEFNKKYSHYSYIACNFNNSCLNVLYDKRCDDLINNSNIPKHIINSKLFNEDLVFIKLHDELNNTDKLMRYVISELVLQTPTYQGCGLRKF
jgi:hypothetical protein